MSVPEPPWPQADSAAIALEPGSSAIRVVEGDADVFATNPDGSRFPVATVHSGAEVVAAATTPLIVVPRLGCVLASTEATTVEGVASFAAAAARRLGAPGLADTELHALPRVIDTAIAEAIRRSADDRRRRSQDSRVQTESALHGVLDRIAFSSSRLRDPSVDIDDHPLAAVVSHIGAADGFTVIVPTPRDLASTADPLQLIAHASGVRYRPVSLAGPWERSGTSSFLGWLTSPDGTDEPVALIRRGRRYLVRRAQDPVAQPLDDATRAALGSRGYEFYAPLDASRAVTMPDVLRLGLRGSRGMWVLASVMALAVAVLGLLTPIVTNWIVSTVIPRSETSLVVQAGLALVMAAGLAFAFTLVQGFSIALISQRATRTMQAAFWDRVLSLPAGFFRRFSSGDLAVRVLAVDSLQSLISVQLVSAVLAAVFGLVNIALMFRYSVSLGLAGVVFLVVTIVVLVLGTRAIGHLATDSLHATRRANGLLVQLLSGIAKIRVANAEDRAQAQYLDLARQQTVAMARQTVVVGRISAWFVFAASAASALFFLVIRLGWGGSGAPITTAEYLAFMSSYGLAFAGVAGLASLISPLANAGPTLELLRPIMDELPETSTSHADPGPLAGQIELRDVSFRYTPDGPLVLRHLSLEIEPGTMVAFVGASGAGKSTITRLLLGFESPDDGQVLYDGRDLRDLDPTLVRRQMGVVVQNGRILRASIMANIVGLTSDDEDAAWRAARAAALGDDIEAMPMGMQTIVDPANVSGGQQQRILLARALVNSPAILILDEATSALDNEGQARVTDAMRALNATRIVIAHRLSTIRHADRIIVMDDGVAVEEGTFDSLIAQDGHFARLVNRQVS